MGGRQDAFPEGKNEEKRKTHSDRSSPSYWRSDSTIGRRALEPECITNTSRTNTFKNTFKNTFIIIEKNSLVIRNRQQAREFRYQLFDVKRLAHETINTAHFFLITPDVTTAEQNGQAGLD